MKLRLGVTAAFLACLTATTLSAAEIGPLQPLLTREEAAAWKNVKTDQEAKAFLDLFWARRDPSPNTPQNEYREQIEARVKYADEQFAEGKTRGSLTDRGRILVIYGAPKSAKRITSGASSMDTPSSADAQRESSATIEWIYEGDEAKAVFGNARTVVRFVDRLLNNQFKLERSRVDFNRAQETAVARAITQPTLTSVPAVAAAPAPAPVAAPPAAPVIQTELTTDAFKAAIAEAKDRGGFATWGEYVTGLGETFVPVGVYLPSSVGLTGPDVTLFGVVKDASGAPVLAFEQPVKATETKGDWFVDYSLRLPAGKHTGTFGVAQGGKIVAVASSQMEVAGKLDKDATAISPLILSNNIYPLTEPQQPTDPFAFGGLRVIPKADRTFKTSDELWYFVELRNPGVETPALPEGQVPVSGAAPVAPMPKLQIKLDVVGKDSTGKAVKMAAPPREVEAIEVRGVPGHFAVGNALPPNTFKPGEYTFTMKVIDTVKKTSYTLTDKFTVVQ